MADTNGNLKLRTFGIFVASFITILVFIFGLSFSAIGSIDKKCEDTKSDVSDIKSSISSIETNINWIKQELSKKDE